VLRRRNKHRKEESFEVKSACLVVSTRDSGTEREREEVIKGIILPM